MKMREKKRRDKAEKIGGGIWAGLAAHEGLKNELFDRAENKAVKSSRSLTDLQGKMKPGDVIFHRVPNTHSSQVIPGVNVTTNDVLSALKGDPFFHASIYQGRGNIVEAGAGRSQEVAGTQLRRAVGDFDKRGTGDYREELKVYRPKLSGEDIASAVDYAKANKGREYSTFGRQLEHAFRHLFDPTGGPSVEKPTCKGVACTELVSEAYPEIFKKRFESPAVMRASPELELIGRYGKAMPTTIRERILSRGVYPLLHNLKWGVGAGAAAYGGMKLADYLKGDE